MVQENIVKGKILIVAGATGSGKSGLAIELAKRLNGQIVSSDSLAIYKELDIGTAKPNKIEQSMAVHHMIDIVDKNANFTVTEYKQQAMEIINNLLARGITPIICGGTGYYINSILYNLSYGKSSEDKALREKYENLANLHGNEYIHNYLKTIDLESANKLHFNDRMRVIRAIEIFELTGKKKSDIKDDLTANYDYLAISIDHDREKLYERINSRVDQMFSDGLIGEVERLKGQGLTLDNQSMQGIGYKEFFEGYDDIEDIKNAIKQNSRRYAKRQITFFKQLKGLVNIPFDNIDSMAEKVVEKFNNNN